MLFGSPEHDLEAENPIQPRPSPASDSGFEIMIEQAFVFQSVWNQGIKPRKRPPPCTEPEKAASPTSRWHVALLVLRKVLRLLGFF